jgi:hypothetical protein
MAALAGAPPGLPLASRLPGEEWDARLELMDRCERLQAAALAHQAEAAVQGLQREALESKVRVLTEFYQHLEADIYTACGAAPERVQRAPGQAVRPSYLALVVRCAELQHIGDIQTKRADRLQAELDAAQQRRRVGAGAGRPEHAVLPQLVGLLRTAVGQLAEAQAVGRALRAQLAAPPAKAQASAGGQRDDTSVELQTE